MWWIVFLLLPVAVIVWLFYEWLEHSRIKYATTKVECQTLSKNQELRLCLISDLHNNRKKMFKVRERIQAFAPDVILLAGDMVDKHKAKNVRAEAFIRCLAELNIPIYYSVGNHEAYMQKHQPGAWMEYLSITKDYAHFLDNESVFLKGNPKIVISGLSLPDMYYKKGKLQTSEEGLPELPVPKEGFHIMMAHNPEYASMYARYHAGFIVSGHLHGGLLRLPLIGGVVSPRLRFTGPDAGLVKLSDTSQMFISRGLGSHTIPLRFFNRVEINFLVLKGVEK